MGNSDQLLLMLFTELWRKENEKEKRVVLFFTTFQSTSLHPERLGPAESIEMTIINAVYSNINFKLSLSVFLPFSKNTTESMLQVLRPDIAQI